MSKRYIEEYRDLSKNPIENCGVTVGLVDDNSYDVWRITLMGPKDTPYNKGVFRLNISFPPDYPNKAPEVYFITPIYHVNVNPCVPKENEGGESLGHVCISTLNWWNPQYTMREVLLNIYSLFFMHNPDSAYGLNRAKEYNEDENHTVYFEKARYFTKKYAKPSKFKINYNRKEDWDFST